MLEIVSKCIWLSVTFLHQAKDRQKKKHPTKGIRLDAEGDASLEDLENVEGERNGVKSSLDGDKTKLSNKKVLWEEYTQDIDIGVFNLTINESWE